MQSLVLEKQILFPKKVDELIQVTIDDSIEYVNKSDGIILKGKIYLTGEVNLEGEIREFLDTLDVDIYASLDQLIDKKQVQLRVEDFDFKIKENKIIFYIKTIIEGVNDVKSTFPVKEPDTPKEETLGTMEALDENTNETKANEPELNIDLENKVREELEEDSIEVISNKDIVNREKVCEFVYKDLDDEPDLKIENNVNVECEVEIKTNIEKKPKKEKQSKKLDSVLNLDALESKEKEELLSLLKDAIIIDKDMNYDVTEEVCEEVNKQTCDQKPIKIIEEKPIKIETNNDTFNYFNLFRNVRKESSVFWKYRVVLKGDTYESIANEYKLSLTTLKSLNNDRSLEVGMLIRIPK